MSLEEELPETDEILAMREIAREEARAEIASLAGKILEASKGSTRLPEAILGEFAEYLSESDDD